MSGDKGDTPRERLETLLGLDAVGVSVTSATIIGQGARACACIRLSNGETMEFDSLRDLAKPILLRAELAACAGATSVRITQDRALAVIALLRDIARRERTATDDDHARDWGESFLQIARGWPVDLSDQASRWNAFADLRSLDEARAQGGGSLAVLIDRDGSRLIRSGHFYSYVRSREGGLSESRIAQRMQRVGWVKRGSTGRIKATRPGLPGVLGWNFLIAPPGWPGSSVHAGVEVTRTRGDRALHSHGEAGTTVNPGTRGAS